MQATIRALTTCGDACAEHRDEHEHCRVCEDACRDSERALKVFLPQLQPSGAAPSRPSQAVPQI